MGSILALQFLEGSTKIWGSTILGGQQVWLSKVLGAYIFGGQLSLEVKQM